MMERKCLKLSDLANFEIFPVYRKISRECQKMASEPPLFSMAEKYRLARSAQSSYFFRIQLLKNSRRHDSATSAVSAGKVAAFRSQTTSGRFNNTSAEKSLSLTCR